MVKQITRGKDIARNTYWSAVGMAAATMLAVQPVFADTIWDRFSTILNSEYGKRLKDDPIRHFGKRHVRSPHRC